MRYFGFTVRSTKCFNYMSNFNKDFSKPPPLSVFKMTARKFESGIVCTECPVVLLHLSTIVDEFWTKNIETDGRTHIHVHTNMHQPPDFRGDHFQSHSDSISFWHTIQTSCWHSQTHDIRTPRGSSCASLMQLAYQLKCSDSKFWLSLCFVQMPCNSHRRMWVLTA